MYLLQKNMSRETSYLNTMENLSLNLLEKKEEKISMVERDGRRKRCIVICIFSDTMRGSGGGYQLLHYFLSRIR